MKRPAVFSKLENTLPRIRRPCHTTKNHTTHYSIVDEQGNAVAVTTTINDWFGSRVTADGLGFLLNDEMDDFSAKPGVPNMRRPDSEAQQMPLGRASARFVDDPDHRCPKMARR